MRPSDRRLASIGRLLDAYDGDPTPGGYALAVVESGATVLERRGGTANHGLGIPCAPDTVFDFASVAKQFTGFCALELVRGGGLDPDASVVDYIPELPEYCRGVRVRRLIGHSSGLRDWYPLVALAGRTEDDRISRDYLLRLALAQREPNFEPGSRYAYSNSGYLLLAEIVRRLAGAPFGAVVADRVFGPLGMRSSRVVEEPGEWADRLAVPYRAGADGRYLPGSDLLAAPGCSSLLSTAGDMAAWLSELDRRRVDGDPLLKAMLEPSRLADGREVGYNYGLISGRWRGHRLVGHGGSWNAFSSELMYYPGARIGTVFVTNRNPSRMDVTERLRRILLEGDYDAGLVPASGDGSDRGEIRHGPDGDAAALDGPGPDAEPTRGLEGTYLSPELGVAVAIARDGRALALEHPAYGRLRLARRDRTAWTGGRYWCDSIAFERDGRGRGAVMRVDSDASNLASGVAFYRA